MTDDGLDRLGYTPEQEKTVLIESKKFTSAKRFMKEICVELTEKTQDYNPQVTINSIVSHLEKKEKFDRILYSEMSNYVYSLESSDRGVFATNVEKLLIYSIDDNNKLSENCRKIIIKIYDHFHLALHQIENANNIFANSIDNAKENLQNQIKGIEKEYISILGIFAAIVLAFVGGITFSTSILQNIKDVSIFRLLLVIDFLAFVLSNVIYILVKFIFYINDLEKDLFEIKVFNRSCLLIAIVIIASWLVSINQFPDFISEILPWCK